METEYRSTFRRSDDVVEPLVREPVPEREETDLGFVERLLGEHPWPDTVKEQLSKDLALLKEKHRDQKLNVSVVGEFSTGKSTFINALLRTELLASGALQGTTVASTILEFGKQHTVAVLRRDGKRKLSRFADLQGVKDALSGLVSENDDAEAIHSVGVSMPFRSLQSTGLRIVDTPGTDATELWHEGVTIRTIEEMSDLSIVLINGTRPLPESFCIFIEENLGNVLDRCVFVVTKLDLVAQRDRDRMLQYVQMKLHNAFGLETPKVLPYYSAEMVGTFAPSPFAKGDKLAVQQSIQTENVIRKHSAVMRQRIKKRKLEQLFEEMYVALDRQMDVVSEIYSKELDLLERSRSVDLEAFLDRQCDDLEATMTETAKQEKEGLRSTLERQIQEVVSYVSMQIHGSTRLDQLNWYLRNELPRLCAVRVQVQEKIAKTFRGKIRDLLWISIRRFRDAFMELYPDLGLIMAQVPNTDKRAGVSAAAGILHDIIPVRAGPFSGPRFDEVKRNAVAQVRVQLEHYFKRTSDRFLLAFDGFVDTERAYLRKELRRYLETYREEVDRRIQEEELQMRRVEDQIATLERDRAALRKRKERLMKRSEVAAVVKRA